VGSFYFKVITLNTSANAYMFVLPNAGADNGFFAITSGGNVRAIIGPNNQVTSGTYNDSAWHRVDFKFITSANPWTLDWQVDGVAQTQVTDALAASNTTGWRVGSTVTTHDLVVELDDVVISQTSGDYPLGEYEVQSLLPTGDGTHNLGTGSFAKSTGGTTNVYDVIDDWPTGTDYVTQTAVDSTGYVEVTFADNSTPGPIEAAKVIWAGNSAGTLANHAIIRIVDSGGTTLVNAGNGDWSINPSIGTNASIIPDPSADGWTDTELDGIKARFGFSTDATPDPYLQSLLVEYAIKPSLTAVVLTATPSLPAATLDNSITAVVLSATPSLPAASVSADSGTSLTAVALSASPSLPAATVNHSITAAALTATPSLPAASTTHSLTAVALSAGPSLPAAQLNHSVTAIVLSAAPSLPAATIDTGSSLVAVELSATPSLPAAQINHSISAAALSASVSLPAATLQQGLAAVALSASPSLPAAALTVSAIETQYVYAETRIELQPILPQAHIALDEQVDAEVLQITPTLPAADITRYVEAATLTQAASTVAASIKMDIAAAVLTVSVLQPAASIAQDRTVSPLVLTQTPILPIADVRRDAPTLRKLINRVQSNSRIRRNY